MTKILGYTLTILFVFSTFTYGSTVLYSEKKGGKLKQIIYLPEKKSTGGKLKNKFNSEKSFEAFLNSRQIKFEGDLKLLKRLKSPYGYSLRYKQYYQGYPVFNSEIIAVVSDNKVVQFFRNDFENFKTPKFGNIESIKSKLLKTRKDFKKIVEWEKGYLGETPCYKFTITCDRDLREVYVNAENGEILKEKSLVICFDGRGKVFLPNPVAYSGISELFDFDDTNYNQISDFYAIVNLTDIDPSGILKNRYVDMTGRGLASPSTFGYAGVYEYTPGSATGANGDYFYTRDDYRFEEVNAYYWITEARKYMESIGYDIPSYSISVNVHYMIDDNSFYSEYDKGLHFGDGGVDDAEDAEIVLHEFMHAVIHYVIPGFGDSWEASALDEGLCDYFAASFSNDPHFRDYIGEWDGTSYNFYTTPHCLRPIITDRHYPEDMKESYYLTGGSNYHWDGVIFSSTLWQIRKAVGKDFDKDVFNMLYRINTSVNFQSAALSLYSSDYFVNDGKFAPTIGYFFYKRGILSSNYLTEITPPTQSNILYFPYISHNSNFETKIGLINTSAQSETVRVLYIAKEGVSILSDKELTLAPGEKYFENVNADEIDADFWIAVESDNKIEGFAVTTDKNKTESYAVYGIKNLSDTIFVPHIASETEYWETYSAIANGTGEDCGVFVNPHEDIQITLNGLTSSFKMTYFEWTKDFYDNYQIQPTKYWATITSTKQNLAAFQFFKRKDVAQLSALPLDSKPSSVLYFPHIAVNGNYWWTGMVFENVSSSEQSVVLTAYDSEGNITEQSNITLSPYEKKVGLVQDFFENFSENSSWIKLEANSQCLIGYALFGTLPEKGARLLSGINAAERGYTKLLFPHVESSENFWTGIAFINISNKNVTVSLKAYNSRGDLLDTKEISNLNPGAKIVDTVKNIFGIEISNQCSYIIAESDGEICGFELWGNLTAVENGETVFRQDYISGVKAIGLENEE